MGYSCRGALATMAFLIMITYVTGKRTSRHSHPESQLGLPSATGTRSLDLRSVPSNMGHMHRPLHTARLQAVLLPVKDRQAHAVYKILPSSCTLLLVACSKQPFQSVHNKCNHKSCVSSKVAQPMTGMRCSCHSLDGS